MASRKQWVNFPAADGRVGTVEVTQADFVDKDVKSVDLMGPAAYVEAKFKKRQSGSLAFLEIKPTDENAVYSETESAQAAGIFSARLHGMTRIAEDGVARFRVKLPPSGGDRFDLEVTDGAKKKALKLKDRIETRRKLFFQLIRMRKAKVIGWYRKPQFKKKFWDTKNKLYLKLQEISPGKKIPNRVNFDKTDAAVKNTMLGQARGQYDQSKAPYSIPVVVVNKLCAPKDLTRNYTITVAGNTASIPLPKPLFHMIDPAVDWYVGMEWFPAAIPGRREFIEKARATVLESGWRIQLDMTGRTPGPGTLSAIVVILGEELGGFSERGNNLIVLASRNWYGGKHPAKEQRDTLVHEMGHKIGMVPGGPTGTGDPDLDGQASYYDGRGHRGGHCHTGVGLLPNYKAVQVLNPAPSCVMFGDDRRTTGKFCAECLQSVRKLDVTPSRKPRLRVQF